MSEPVIASKTPYPIDVESGKKYFWCSCGKSAQQPFCDGSHQGSDFTPLPYTAKADEKLYFCGCKRSSNAPLCDGSHAEI